MIRNCGPPGNTSRVSAFSLRIEPAAGVALEPALTDPGHTIRLVSEILESNGSSSMATVCGGYMALRAGDIEMTDTIAGIAMGLVQEGEKYAILTDIMGLEDHDGDMDFKVTGSREGITALQMDIKLGGVSLDLLKEAFYQAKAGRSLWSPTD